MVYHDGDQVTKFYHERGKKKLSSWGHEVYRMYYRANISVYDREKPGTRTWVPLGMFWCPTCKVVVEK